ncbi:cell wall-binding protein [Clostridium perfringens]|uniref:N-acetylmuramoyl-L-alanine amidase family protein n=1 Tax=Clostridium perfringens TaxID=1502 RepID=UPI002245405D|nr:cell wall-binding protein [Clostridium perfringens]MCX0355625.1 cell wall-binding protein [Clostridium perfringens]
MLKKSKLFSLGLILTLSLQSTSVFALNNTNQSYNQKIYSSDGWVFENNNWVYYINNKVSIGWQYIDGYWYYFNPDGIMQTGWQYIDNQWYYFRPAGNMRIGWEKINDYWYYFNSDGVMQTGWQYIGNQWYYFRPAGNMRVDWEKINDYWYYFNSDGVMQTGWQYIGNQWYYFIPDGNMRIGWEKINGYWYYFNSDGVMLKNITQSIDGQDYRFNSNGEMLSDIWDGATYINSNGIVLNPSISMSNSYTQYKLFNYMSDEKHREDVHRTSIKLHGGITSNNCVYFASEALRRVGVNIPLYTANTYQLERELLSKGWKKSTDLTKLKPGDIVFSGSSHAFIFMHWYDSDYAYIVDNQKKVFSEVLHKRKITGYDSVYDTYKSTHFYYLPN